METSEEILIGLGVLVAGYLGYKYYEGLPATSPIAGSSLIPQTNPTSSGSPPVTSSVGQAIAAAVAQIATPTVTVTPVVAPVVAPVIPVTTPNATGTMYSSGLQSGFYGLASNPVSDANIQLAAFDINHAALAMQLGLTVSDWNRARSDYASARGLSVRLATGSPFGTAISSSDTMLVNVYHQWLQAVGAE